MSASEQLHPSTQRTPSLFPSARTHGLQSLPPNSRTCTQPAAATHGAMQVTACYGDSLLRPRPSTINISSRHTCRSFPTTDLSSIPAHFLPLIETTLSRGYGMAWPHVHHPTERFRLMCPTEFFLQLR
eukprot:GHVU01103451.1.p1 GENE.GHVU01103451.1~~GHVU01103451.1.p1  ORF type:complete len:128 (+),score=1.93 GHVU01103451.1:1868-2251(+)